MQLKCFIVFICICYTACREIPSYVHLCNRKDPKVGECFINTVYEIMPHLVKGIPEMDIPSIDPLHFTSIKAKSGNAKAVKLDIELFNGTMSGLRNLKIKNLIMDFDHIKFYANMSIKNIKIDATYKLDGNILLFELNGVGHTTFNASEIITESEWYGSRYTKNNKTHIQIDNIIFRNVHLKGISVRLDDVFKNNEVLTETVNKAISDNIDGLREELEPIFKETIGEFIQDYFNRVYKILPLDKLYPLNAPFYRPT